MSFELPSALTEEILRGRAVAFVGAGFSAPVVPDWRGLLVELARAIPNEKLARDVENASSAANFEMLGQLIKLGLGARFESEVRRVLDKKAEVEAAEDTPDVESAYAAGCFAVMKRRMKLLAEIPFKAILTLNVDPLLEVRHGRARWDVLRGDLAWWERADPNGRLDIAPPILKLHGDANGKPRAPVVLARSDYRKLLYEDARYANFLRAVFASHTVLFLGVSFTDAYLNELRSETLAFLSPAKDQVPWYAIINDLGSEVQAYYREHEGIAPLTYDSREAPAWSGFDRWLEVVHDATSARRRLRAILEGKRIVWVDRNIQRNAPGLRELRGAGAHVEIIGNPEEFKSDDARADLVLTCFRYSKKGPMAFRLMERLRMFEERPPVIVFASGDHAEENRRELVRRGGWEYASGWQELFRLVEVLFGRR